MISYAAFAAILFLFLLNGFLMGRLQAVINAVLTAAILAVVVLAILFEGWMALIYLLAIWLIGGNFLFTPLAKMVAGKLLSR